MSEGVAGVLALAAALLPVSKDAAWAGFLVFLRVGAAMALLPAFGDRGVPTRVRLVLALAFTAVVTPAVAQGLPAPTAAPLALMAGEVVAGLALGLALRLIVAALQLAGAIAAQASALAQTTGPAAVEPQPAIGHLFLTAGLALAAAAGLHVSVAEALILSYAALPAGWTGAGAALADWTMAGAARAFGLAFSIAAPFVIASVLYNLALGGINRAMPLLMVTFIGAPALSLGTLALLAVAAPASLAAWHAALMATLGNPFGAAP